MWEIVTSIPRIEEANTDYIAQLLAPLPRSPPPGAVISPQSLAITTYSSEASKSVTRPFNKENEE